MAKEPKEHPNATTATLNSTDGSMKWQRWKIHTTITNVNGKAVHSYDKLKKTGEPLLTQAEVWSLNSGRINGGNTVMEMILPFDCGNTFDREYILKLEPKQ